MSKPLAPLTPVAPEQLTQCFDGISLEQLNSKAAMMERLDNKYIISGATLQAAARHLAEHFDILEIDGERRFTYDTCYFDDEHYSSYFSHHQGRRRRLKVRVRKYVEASLCFVEIKLKALRGSTIKKRFNHAVEQSSSLDESALGRISDICTGFYGERLYGSLAPVLNMRYRRMTLVAKQGGERMTIDGNLTFSSAEQTLDVSQDAFIVETKSANGMGIADSILRLFHQHPTPHCSKYCVGMAALKLVPRYNHFLPALRQLGLATAV